MSLRRTVHITYEEGIILENNGYELGPLDGGDGESPRYGQKLYRVGNGASGEECQGRAVSEKRSCGAGDKE